MRKRRIKALKQRVEQLTGKPLAGIQYVDAHEGAVAYIPSMRRRVKKAFLAMQREGVSRG